MDITVLTAIIASVSALAGVTLSQVSAMIQEHLNRSHQKKKLFREKYEQLVEHLTEGQVWVPELMQSETLSQASLHTPIHARKVLSLSAIYFPMLLESSQNYLNACAALHVVIVENHQFVTGVTAGAQAVQKNRPAVESACGNVQNTRNELDKKIIKYALMYTSA